MGDRNQHLFVEANRDRFVGPFLEIGSKNYGSTQDLRAIMGGPDDYVGLDMADGDGVDIVLDLTRPFEEIDAALGGKRFGTVFCLSVLEHCAQPFAMADTLTRLLTDGGVLCVSVPWAWQFHGYPSDYWRFSHEGVKLLFPALTFDATRGKAALRDGEFEPLDENIGRLPLRTSPHRAAGRGGRAVAAGLMKALGRLPGFDWLLGHPYVMAPTMISMIGRKDAGAAGE
ncbi:MAG: hypothetical protein AAF907_03640 [Planctomycetota bacterium]